MKKHTQRLLLIALFLSAAVGTFAMARLNHSYLEYRKGNDAYEELKEFAEEPEIAKKPDAGENKGEETAEELSYLQVDFEGLKGINQDVVAWIQIPALNISYPVVQGIDNSFYLSHLFSGEANINGSIFIDYHNQPDFTGQNTIIYGHNMKNKSMFGTLEQYQDENLYQQYPIFYIYIPEYRLEYQIFSCYAARVGSISYTYDFPAQDDFLLFLENIFSYSDYDTGVTAESTDKVITLSTCVNSSRDYRFLVHGKLINKTAIGGEEKKDD